MGKIKYLIAVDFEATCDEFQSFNVRERNAEIIEFPAILINMETGQIESEFHENVRPIHKPILSSYCKNLTGIKQETIDKASNLSIILDKFDNWLQDQIIEFNLRLPEGLLPVCITNPKGLSGNSNCAFIAWSNCDFYDFLAIECERKSINKKLYLNRWIDLQRIYSKICGYRKCRFREALNREHIYIRDSIHSGLYDARNLAHLAYKIRNRLC